MAMRELRRSLVDQQAFVDQVDKVQRQSGYRLIAALADDHGPALAVAGFRAGENLAWGRHLYVDDLSTLPAARQHGHARRLLDWLREDAQRLGCTQIHLDSGVGPERLSAHRLYFNAGYRISSHHFAVSL